MQSFKLKIVSDKKKRLWTENLIDKSSRTLDLQNNNTKYMCHPFIKKFKRILEFLDSVKITNKTNTKYMCHTFIKKLKRILEFLNVK